MDDRIKELDGLRGLAVLLVMAVHAFKRASEFTRHPVLNLFTRFTSVGWVGVDIFFVLSGFLITSILLRTRERPDYFKNFYVRRILRIFPLYYAVTAAILLLVPVLDPEYAPTIPAILPIMLLYLQNWTSIFDGPNLTVFLAVTWSLAIEEQFYLIWPAVVYYTRREHLLKWSLGLILASILLRILGLLFWKDPLQAANFFYYNTFTRFEELVAGGLLAQAFLLPAWRERIAKAARPVFWVGLTAFLLLCLGNFPALPHPVNSLPLALGGYTSVAVFAAALVAILLTSAERSPFRQLFRNGFLAFWGKYSYAAYLVHMPMVFLMLDMVSHYRLLGWRAYSLYLLLVFGATALVSFCTWHLLEKHFLNLKRFFNYS